jgi:uncharacterized protein (DUF924 family)
MTTATATALLDFWFGTTREDPAAFGAQSTLWFGARGETVEQRNARDEDLRQRFGDLVARAASGDLDVWVSTPRGRLALILLLDQLPRNLYRGTARAFATDAAARALCEQGLATGDDVKLTPIERVFFYLPLEHAEDLAAQQRCVALFTTLLAAVPADQRGTYEGYLHYAEWHRDLIARFGRFPHRNALLGRTATPEEIAYLEGGGATFGQSASG